MIRRLALAACAATLLLAAPAAATLVQIDPNQNTVKSQAVQFVALTPLGYSQITSLSGAAGLGSIPSGATYAVIVPEGAVVRWRDDGTNPTTSVGTELQIGQPLPYGGSLAAIKFIQETATAKLDVTFYK